MPYSSRSGVRRPGDARRYALAGMHRSSLEFVVTDEHLCSPSLLCSCLIQATMIPLPIARSLLTSCPPLRSDFPAHRAEDLEMKVTCLCPPFIPLPQYTLSESCYLGLLSFIDALCFSLAISICGRLPDIICLTVSGRCQKRGRVKDHAVCRDGSMAVG